MLIIIGSACMTEIARRTNSIRCVFLLALFVLSRPCTNKDLSNKDIQRELGLQHVEYTVTIAYTILKALLPIYKLINLQCVFRLIRLKNCM